MRANQISFLSFLIIFFSSFIQPSEFSLLAIAEHAKHWSIQCAQEMTLQELQFTTDLVQLLYMNAFLDSEIQRCFKPLLELSQTVRNNVSDPLNPNKELASLKALADKIESITTIRLVYTQMLDEYLDYYDQNKNDRIERALYELQLYASQALHSWADEQQNTTTSLLKKSSQSLIESAQNIYATANLHTGLSHRDLPFMVEKQDTSLAIFNAILKNASHIMITIDKATNAINATADHAMDTICLGTYVYEEHYRALRELRIEYGI